MVTPLAVSQRVMSSVPGTDMSFIRGNTMEYERRGCEDDDDDDDDDGRGKEEDDEETEEEEGLTTSPPAEVAAYGAKSAKNPSSRLEVSSEAQR